MDGKDRTKKKNHLGLFKDGNLFSPKGMKLPEHVQDTDENSNLRPQCLEETQNDFIRTSIIYMGKMLENINTCIKEHSGRKCRKADLVYKTEHKHGLAMKLQFRCRTCGYE